MSDLLRELLRQGSDTVERPHLDIDDLVMRANRRLVRRRLAIGALGAAAVVLVAAGGLALRLDNDRSPSPAPPGPSQNINPLGTPRELTYAEGSTIHFGNTTIDAGTTVDFVEATDDGVVYVREDETSVWFSDGSVTERIGDVQRIHLSVPLVTANPGSLIAWVDAEDVPGRREIVVYDSGEREEVGRVPVPEVSPHSLALNGDRLYWQVTLSGGATEVRRHDLSTTTTETISHEAYADDLASNPRMLRIGRPTYWDAGIPDQVGQRLAFFKRVGTLLVPSDSVSSGSQADETAPTRLLSGPEVIWHVPGNYGAGFDESLVVVQWLDDAHLVLFAHHEHNEFPAHVADLLRCPVPTGTCVVVVPASKTPFVPPGDVP